MSSSPASTVLATPTYSRSGRERKTVQKYGSMIDSDVISDPEEEDYGYRDPDDEDESFEEAKVKESDDEDEEGYGEEGDDEMIVSKPIKAKQGQPKKKSDASKTYSNKSKPAGVLLPKSAKTLAAKKESSQPSLTTSKAAISIKQTLAKTSKTPSKRVLSPVAAEEEPGPEEQKEAEAGSPEASPEPPSKKSKTSPTKPLQLFPKPLNITASSTASTKAKSAPRPKGVGVGVGIVLAKKESTTSTGSKAAARGATNKGFVPLKKVEVAPSAKTSKGGKKGVVLVTKSGVEGTNKASAKAEMGEEDHEDDGQDGQEAQGAGDGAVGGGNAEEQNEPVSDGNESDDDEKVSSEKKAKPLAKASTAGKARGNGKTPKSPSTAPVNEDAEKAPPQDMEEHVEAGQTSEVQETEGETGGNEDVASDVDVNMTMSASQPDSQGLAGEPDSQSPASTPKRKASNTSDTSSSRKSSSPRKLAPAEKIPASARVAIIQALCTPNYLKTIPFGTISQALSSQGEDMPSAKLSRHWREVLSADLKEYFRYGKAVTSPTKSASSSGKQKVGVKARKAIWKGVVEGYDKANWKEIEEESGISTTKLKRHLRDVMRKEVEKVIGA